MDSDTLTGIQQDLLKNEYGYLGALGIGDQASVILVEHLPTGKKYAAKLFKYEIVYSSHQKKENVTFSIEGFPPPFFEVRLGMLTTSPHLLKYLQFFVGVKYLYAIMELHTTNLKIALKKGCKMNAFEKVEHIFKLGCGLEYLHTNRILHCDLKLENILVSPHRVVISDLGLSGFADSDDMRRGCHAEIFRAPEHINREKWMDMLKDYHAIAGRHHYSGLEEGEWWSYGIICLHIIYGIIELEQVSHAIYSHPKCSSYHKKQYIYGAFINIYALTREKSVEDIMGTFPDGSVEKELIELLQKYFLKLNPFDRLPIRSFLENPLFKKYGFDINKENMNLPMPLVQTDRRFLDYFPKEVYDSLTQSISLMNKLCEHFHLYSLILMDAIDFLLQKRIAYNIHSEKLGLYGIISVYLMVLLYDYRVKNEYNFTIANIIAVLKIKISFEMFYEHLMNVISLEAGKFLFESLYYYLETEEQVKYGKNLQTVQLYTYLSFKNPREVSELIKNKLFPTKTKKRILVED